MQDQPQKVRGTLSRRRFLQLVGSTASITALAACVTPDAAPTSSSAGTIPPAEKQQLIFWGYAQHPMDLAAVGFAQEHPEIEWISPHPAEHGEKITAAFAAGSGLPDLYWAEATQAQAWGCQELLIDLTDQLEPVSEHYHPAKLAETFVVKHGSRIGWPGDLGVSGWYYRRDQLQAMGWNEDDLATVTWADFMLMAAELKQQGLYAYCFPADGWSVLFFLILHQVGGTAVSQDGKKITVGDDKGIYAMQLVKQLWESGGGLAVEWWSPSYWAALRDGKLIGDFAAAWVRGFWEANLQDASDPGTVSPWQIAPLPSGDGIQYRTGIWGGAQVVTPKAAENPENAILFMQYALGSVAGAGHYSAWGVLPAYRPYLTSEACLAQHSPLFGEWPFCSFWAAQESELSPAYFRPAGWDAVNMAVQQEMMAIVRDTYAVEDGLSRIVERALPDFKQARC